jgi:protein-disulfide isomerase
MFRGRILCLHNFVARTLFAPPSQEDYVIRRLSLTGLLLTAVLALGTFQLSRSSAAAAQPSPAAQAMQGVADIDPHQAEGSKSAPMIMEVFSDYQCPACKQLFTTTDRTLVDNYVNTGKIYLVHRDFPLPMHAYSRVAARYARAAAQLGKLEPVERALFQSQEKWEVSGDVDGTVAAALTPAEMAKVRALVKGGTMDALIDKDTALGQIYHVSSTPTTILHVKEQTYPVAGVVSFDVLRSFIDQLLGQK